MFSNQNNMGGQEMEWRPQSARTKEAKAEIVFGTPSKNCEGVGICRMIGPNYLAGKAIKCPHVTGYLSLDMGRNVLYVRFSKRSLSSEMVARHFCKRQFKVTESYKVPVHISRALGTEQMVTIQEGAYAVKETGEDWIVIFGVRGWSNM